MSENPVEYAIRNAAENPEGLAIIGPNTSITNKEFLSSVRQIAWFLRSSGVRPGDGVLLALSPEVEAIAIQSVHHEAGFSAHLSIASENQNFSNIGFTWALINNSEHEIAGLSNLILNPSTLQAIDEVPEGLEPIQYVSEDDLGRIIFSSGTTGNPKAVPFTLRQLTARSEFLYKEIMQPGPFLCALGFDVSFGLMTFMASQKYGVPYLQLGSVESLIAAINSQQVQSLATSPIALERVVQYFSKNAPSIQLKHVITTGGFLPLNLVEAAEKSLGAEVWSLYGSTEVGFVARRIGRGQGPDDAGELFAHALVEIVDSEDNQLPEGEVGIVRVRTPWKGASYFGETQDSGSIFRDGYFYPGDLGRIKGNRLSILGRANLVINVGGIKIDPTPIENYCKENFEAIEDAVGFQHITDSGAGLFVMAIKVMTGFDGKKAIGQLQDRFGGKAPAGFFPVSEIPRNSLGKPLRNLLATEFKRLSV